MNTHDGDNLLTVAALVRAARNKAEEAMQALDITRKEIVDCIVAQKEEEGQEDYLPNSAKAELKRKMEGKISWNVQEFVELLRNTAMDKLDNISNEPAKNKLDKINEICDKLETDLYKFAILRSKDAVEGKNENKRIPKIDEFGGALDNRYSFLARENVLRSWVMDEDDVVEDYVMCVKQSNAHSRVQQVLLEHYSAYQVLLMMSDVVQGSYGINEAAMQLLGVYRNLTDNDKLAIKKYLMNCKITMRAEDYFDNRKTSTIAGLLYDASTALKNEGECVALRQSTETFKINAKQAMIVDPWLFLYFLDVSKRVDEMIKITDDEMYLLALLHATCAHGNKHSNEIMDDIITFTKEL